jgi:osmoprotectant transport system permease protein
MINYLSNNYLKLLTALLEHLQLVGITLLISIPLSFILSYIAGISKVVSKMVFSLMLLIYCIPSIALFTLLIPVLGLGKATDIVGMTAYNQILLMRSIFASWNSIPESLKTAAKSNGMHGLTVSKYIYLPIMLPHLISGLRIATISTTGIATMAALINAGGLGKILFEGMRTSNMPKLIIGIVLSAGLAVLLNIIFGFFETKALFKATGGNIPRV